MLEKIELKYGDETAQQTLTIPLTPITIFVGPNNSGKSLVLREIETLCTTPKDEYRYLLLKNASLKPYSKEDFQAEISEYLTEEEILEYHISKINAYGTFTQIQIYKNLCFTDSEALAKKQNYFKKYIALHTLRLDGTNRLQLLQAGEIGNLLDEKPKNRMRFLFDRDDTRKKLKEIVHNAIGQHFYIAQTEGGKLHAYLSREQELFPNIEKSVTKEAIVFYKKATEINDMSDGVRAFCGIVSSLLAGEPRIILIDEPEAFLHPSLAHRLGCDVGALLRDSEKLFFASTHSPDFLMGCIQSKQPINIVRLTYKDGISTARVLESEQILKLMRNPLLRSTGVLDALFFEHVIVCEADSDRAFYQEINERLLEKNDPRGIKNCLFINAQNKQTVWDIVHPLRALGIPVAGIVDIDVLKDKAHDFKKILHGTNFPALQHEGMLNQRLAILRSFHQLNTSDEKDSEKKMKREGGVRLLKGEEAEACKNFFEQFTQYGAFIVAGGELESWLKDEQGNLHGTQWLIKMFETMGEDPNLPDYIIPTQGDVWDFIGQIKTWFDNPSRKGIPSEYNLKLPSLISAFSTPPPSAQAHATAQTA